MNPEEGVTAHDLNASVFKVERVVRNGYLFPTTIFNVLS